MLVLLGDIGGTTSRFALSDGGGRPLHAMSFRNDAWASPQDAVAAYLDRTRVQPRGAVLACAGPVEGGRVTLTNRPDWTFSKAWLAAQFGLDRAELINDFSAVAWSVQRLGTHDLRPIGPPAMAVEEDLKVVIGPGTGLGVAALAPLDGRWHVIASEGGHASLGPREHDEFAIFARLASEAGPVSAEMVLSGPGMERLSRAMTGRDMPSEFIIDRALQGEAEPLAVARLFVRLLGRVAGDLALTFRARGGLYLAGGVGRGLGRLLDDGEFRRAFERHPPYEAMLARIPTLLITYDEPGLLGCAAVAGTL